MNFSTRHNTYIGKKQARKPCRVDVSQERRSGTLAKLKREGRAEKGVDRYQLCYDKLQTAITWKALPNIAFEARSNRFLLLKDGERRICFDLVFYPFIETRKSDYASGIAPHNKHLGHARKRLAWPSTAQTRIMRLKLFSFISMFLYSISAFLYFDLWWSP